MDEIKPVAMTQPETVSVTQADRDAAADYLADIVPTMPRLVDEVRANQTALARAFARYRIAAEQALSAMPSGLLAEAVEERAAIVHWLRTDPDAACKPYDAIERGDHLPQKGE